MVRGHCLGRKLWRIESAPMTKQWHTLFHGWKNSELLLPKEELTPLKAVTIVHNFEIGTKRLLEVTSRLLSGKKLEVIFLWNDWPKGCVYITMLSIHTELSSYLLLSHCFLKLFYCSLIEKKLYINSSICYLFRMQNVSCKSTLEEFALDTEKFCIYLKVHVSL